MPEGEAGALLMLAFGKRSRDASAGETEGKSYNVLSFKRKN